MTLADEEIRAVLARAEEIQRVSTTGMELEAVIEAAGEVGLERAAVERALRERLGLTAAPPAAGDLVFAQSSDGKFYVAEVTAVSGDGFRVRFFRGGEHSVSLDALRPCSFLPGERVVVSWPWWGPWTCTVVSYMAEKRRVTVSDGWGENRTFPIGEVWLNPKRRPGSPGHARHRVYATLLGAGATVGAILGAIITALLT